MPAEAKERGEFIVEKNEVLLFSEVIYQINACETPRDLERSFFSAINLYIPFSFASYIQIDEEADTGRQIHSVRFCRPASFSTVERKWLALQDKVNTMWLSNSTESVVVRCSELFAGNSRLNTPSYQEVFQKYNIFDDLQMNVVCNGRTIGRLSLYRTHSDGAFFDADTDKLRLLSKHINQAFSRCYASRAGGGEADPKVLAENYGLTRREGEILGCIVRGMDNAAICAALSISKNTLYKHNNSIFQKCGVKSRWELLRLRS